MATRRREGPPDPPARQVQQGLLGLREDPQGPRDRPAWMASPGRKVSQGLQGKRVLRVLRGLRVRWGRSGQRVPPVLRVLRVRWVLRVLRVLKECKGRLGLSVLRGPPEPQDRSVLPVLPVLRARPASLLCSVSTPCGRLPICLATTAIRSLRP
jgi:hypothetical protein